MKFFETKAFRQLAEEWEQKLEESGFIDIEKSVGEGRELRQYSANAYRQAASLVKETRAEYYTLLSERCAREEFESEIQRYIMQSVAEGARLVEVHRNLLSFNIPINYETIRFIVRRHEHKWKIRKYTSKQMKKRRL